MSFNPQGKATTTSMVVGSRRKHHTSWADGSEMVEEFDIASKRLVLRKIRWKSKLGKLSNWKLLIGEPEKKLFNPMKDLIAKSNSNPEFIQQDTQTHFQWRIRNLPYDKSVYQLSIDKNRQQIVLRTTNKKYFKRICVPSMKSCGEKLQDNPNILSYTHANNTLIIQYKKPEKVRKAEAAYAQKRAKAGSETKQDENCKQQ
mmetsp:Transcript_15800/g.23807  ORF Transcript_15800/g.23807 Transcript_15800/m.23807 type:complete len:201 (+) Transcript_15800:2602-3204(+)